MKNECKIEEYLKVAFLLNVDKNWLGGLNYYRNLLTAVKEYGKKNINYVIFVSKKADMSLLRDYPEDIPVVHSGFFTIHHPLWILRRAVAKLTGYDLVGERYLLSKGVSVISHAPGNDKYRKIKTSTWIPDFQHKYCKEFFSQTELDGRDEAFLIQAKNNDVVILSSHAAEDDFKKFFPQFADKAKVLQFVPTLNLNFHVDGKKLQEKYNIKDKFFFLPNQYWIHKNHMIVLKALKILKDQGKEVQVVSTGNTADYRAPHLMDEIKEYIKNDDLDDNYHILGLIPYDDVQLLADCCHAYINPSYFEGWSTTVEEAKYRGKRIILSDLKVHREQNPKYGIFFDPHDEKALAEKMWQVWNEPRIQESKEILEAYSKDMKKKFAERFEKIIQRLITVS